MWIPNSCFTQNRIRRSLLRQLNWISYIPYSDPKLLVSSECIEENPVHEQIEMYKSCVDKLKRVLNSVAVALCHSDNIDWHGVEPLHEEHPMP